MFLILNDPLAGRVAGSVDGLEAAGSAALADPRSQLGSRNCPEPCFKCPDLAQLREVLDESFAGVGGQVVCVARGNACTDEEGDQTGVTQLQNDRERLAVALTAAIDGVAMGRPLSRPWFAGDSLLHSTHADRFK